MAAPGAASPPLTEADDATLAVALIEKNVAAPRVAWTRFSPLVRRILRRSLGPQHDVEDIVQDVFLCLFQRVHTLRDPVALKAFVIAITQAIVYAQPSVHAIRAREEAQEPSEAPATA